MRYIKDLVENEKLCGVYLVKDKRIAQTKAGKDYYTITLVDKTGTLDTRIWEPQSVDEFEKLDYVGVKGTVSSYNGNLQASVNWLKKAPEGSYNIEDYLPVSPHDISQMTEEFNALAAGVTNRHLSALLNEIFFVQGYFEKFKTCSAASSVHHAFIGGLLQHTLEVAKICDYLETLFPVLNPDLLTTAALLHDVGKIYEFTPFPENTYSDEGNLLGHIVIGIEIIDAATSNIPDFPADLAAQLKHCIVAHHGELEWGSPKKPALVEAIVLHLADNISAKVESFTELADKDPEDGDWYGFQRTFDSRMRRTTVSD